MKCYEWLNEQVGDFDVFIVADKRESDVIINHFATENAKGCKAHTAGEWYYFVNTQNKTITPMPILALAFGGQYNGDLPFGKKIQFIFNVDEYSLKLYN